MSGKKNVVSFSHVKGQKSSEKMVSRKTSFVDLKRKHEEVGLSSSKKVVGLSCRVSALHAGTGRYDYQK